MVMPTLPLPLPPPKVPPLTSSNSGWSIILELSKSDRTEGAAVEEDIAADMVEGVADGALDVG